MWHRYWVKQAEETNKMIYFFRFEDVIANPTEELTNLYKFILGMESLKGTVIEKKIEEVVNMNPRKNQAYKPRTGGANKNLKSYKQE